MRILAVDPGPTPGLASYDTETQEFRAWVAEHWEGGCSYITMVTPDSNPAWNVIVIERFMIGGQRGKASNETIEMIGVARWYALEWGIPLVEQQPGAHKFITPQKLKALGWHTPGPDHARSATGHLLMYLVKEKLIDVERLLN